MSRFVDQKTYQTFEEFEREELRRDGYFESVDSMIGRHVRRRARLRRRLRPSRRLRRRRRGVML